MGLEGKSQNPGQTPVKAYDQMGESAENWYGLGKLHYVLPSQVRVQQENHDPTWLIKTRSAEEFHKGT